MKYRILKIQRGKNIYYQIQEKKWFGWESMYTDFYTRNTYKYQFDAFEEADQYVTDNLFPCKEEVVKEYK